MKKDISIILNEKWYEEFSQKAALKNAPTDAELLKALEALYQEAIITLAEDVDNIPHKFSELKGIRINSQEDSYTLQIPEEDFRLLCEAINHSILQLATEKDKKRIRRLMNSLFNEQGTRFFSILLIQLGLKKGTNTSVSYTEAKQNLKQFIDKYSFVKSSLNQNNNRSRTIKRHVLRELRRQNTLSKNMRNLLSLYVKEKYQKYKHLDDKQLFSQLLEECQKKLDELTPNREMNSNI